MATACQSPNFSFLSFVFFLPVFLPSPRLEKESKTRRLCPAESRRRREKAEVQRQNAGDVCFPKCPSEVPPAGGTKRGLRFLKTWKGETRSNQIRRSSTILVPSKPRRLCSAEVPPEFSHLAGRRRADRTVKKTASTRSYGTSV